MHASESQLIGSDISRDWMQNGARFLSQSINVIIGNVIRPKQMATAFVTRVKTADCKRSMHSERTDSKL